MKRRWIALALLLAVLATAAWAQSIVQDGQTTTRQSSSLGGHIVRTDSTQDANTGDGNGNVYVREAYPDAGRLWKYQSIIQSTLYPTYARISTSVLKGPQADSSLAKDMLGANRMALALSYTLRDSTSMALLGIQVRTHLTDNTDSVSTFIWPGWGTSTDITGAIKDSSCSSIDPLAGVNSAGIFMGDTVNALIGERPVWLHQTNVQRYRWIPLMSQRGEWLAAPYVSVRVRIIRLYGTSGVARTGTTAPSTVVNLDLVGWR
jgi:opacity protein-like surface antigen